MLRLEPTNRHNQPVARWFVHLLPLLLCTYFLAPLVANASVEPQASLVQPTRLPIPIDETGSLRSILADQGSVRVIVYLDTPAVAEDPRLGARRIADQRLQIKRAQERVVRALTKTQSRVHRQFRTIPGFAVTVDAEGLARLTEEPEVISIVKDTAVPLLLDGTIPIIEADEMHALGWTGQGHAVAILDTGVDRDHPMFLDANNNSRVVAEACFSSNGTDSESLCPSGAESQFGEGAAADCTGNVSGCGHGTHVAGIAAGSEVQSSGLTFSGVAPEADIIAIQVFSKFTAAACERPSPCVMSYTSDQVAALEWLLSQDTSQGGSLQVASANMSLGGGRFSSHCDTANVAPAIRNLKNIGVATAIASGNSGYSDSISSPACVSDAIAVGATTNSDVVAFYTSASEKLIDVYAPGSGILSAANGGGYVSYSGTSMAAPHVAGAWALMKQAGVGDDSAAGVSAIENVLKETGNPISDRQTSTSSTPMGYSHPRIALKTALERYGSQDDWLTVRITGQGAGVVTSSPAGINCGSACSMVVVSGDVIVLQATPDAASEFGGFEGCSSVNQSQCTIDITGNATVTVTFDIAAPLNDDFVDARVLTGTSLAELASTVGATFEAGEPLPTCDGSGGASIWFKWSLPADGLPSNVRIDTLGSEFDTILDVFTGAELTALTSLGCNFGTFDNNWTDATVSFEAALGEVYYFRISGYFATSGNAKLNLTLSALTYQLTVATDGGGAGDVTGPGIQCGESNSLCNEAYTVNDVVTLTATPNASSDFDGWIGDCATFAAGPECALSMVGNKSTTAFFKTKLPNDNLEDAQAVSLTTAEPFTADVDVSLASTEMNEIIPSCGAIQSSVWYRWVAPADVSTQPVTLDLSGSDASLDGGVAVYTSSADPAIFAALSELDCLTKATAVGPLILRLVDDNGVSVIQPNEVYYIQLGRSGPVSGTARLKIAFGNQRLSIQQTVIDAEPGQLTEPGGIEVISNGDFCFTQNCTKEFATGQNVTLRVYTPTTAGTNPGGVSTHGFVGWVGCDEVSGRVCQVTMSADKTVTAQFEQTDAKALSLTLLGRLQGRVRSPDLGIDCNNTATLDDDRVDWQTCAAGYRLGETVQLSAQSVSALVVRWSENCTPNGLDAWRCDVVMSEDQAVSAEFLDAHVLTSSVLGIGQIQSSTTNLGRKPDCQGECFYYPTGQVIELEAVADPRYRFEQWTGACRGTEPVCQITLNQDRNVGAIFSIIPTVFRDQFNVTNE